MAKNDFIHTTISVYREKLDNAMKGDNAAADILQAVQELLMEINENYPQTAFRPEMIADSTKKARQNDAGAAGRVSNSEKHVPDGVQFMLANIAAHKQEQ